jgi:hypothetical protein
LSVKFNEANVFMANSKQLAGLIGPTIMAVTLSELFNFHIWSANTAAGVHLNGALLFIAGLSIVRIHNCWTRDWTVAVTIVGWLCILAGLFRMFAPELQLEGARNASAIIVSAIVVLILGILLTIKSYGAVK